MMLGWGVHFDRERLYASIDALAVSHQTCSSSGSTNNLVPKLRLTVGLPFGDRFAVFGGLSMNVRIPVIGDLDGSLSWVERAGLGEENRELLLWPGAFAGVRF